MKATVDAFQVVEHKAIVFSLRPPTGGGSAAEVVVLTVARAQVGSRSPVHLAFKSSAAIETLQRIPSFKHA